MSIREFLSGKSIFVTGATGFLGKPLLEKILREVPDVEQLYLLIRPKTRPSGDIITAGDRMEEEVIGSDVFNRLRDELDDFDSFIHSKLTAVPGDISAEGLDMEPDEYDRLSREADIIINSAAVVVFDERLDYAVQLNALGPKRLLDFAKRSETPALFIHVSTAYVNGQRVGLAPEAILEPNQTIAEELNNGPSPKLDIDSEVARALERGRQVEDEARQPGMFEQFHRAALKELGPGYRPGSKKVKSQTEAERNKFIRSILVREGMERSRSFGWNDTYTFTKAIGEQFLVRERGDIPVAIIRPSIIESAYAEPYPGWLDGLRMADPLIAAYGKGRLQDFPGKPDSILDLVPVDYVANALLAAIPYTASKGGIQLFQVATGEFNPMRLQEMVTYIADYFSRNPMKDKKGEPITVSPFTFPSRKAFLRRNYFKYQLPFSVLGKVSSVVPGMSRMRSRSFIILKAIERMNYYAELYGPYVEYSCQFGAENTRQLLSDLDDDERGRFDFDVRKIDWRHYICDVHVPGLKRHVLKMEAVDEEEPPDRHSDDRKTREDPEKELESGIQTIQDLYIHSAVRFPNKTALQIKRNGQFERFTFQQIRELARQFRTSLAKAGLQQGDRVLLLAENQPEWGLAYFGAISLGLTVVPVDRQTRADELLRMAEFVESKFLMTSPASRQALEVQAGDDLKKLQLLNINNYALLFGAPDCSESPHSADEVADRVEVSPEDVASIIFTSGTTIDPKGVMITHRNFIANLFDIAEVIAPYETDQFLSVLPMHHAFEFTCGFLMPIFGGACITCVTALKSRVILETMQETGTTCLVGVPRLFKLFHDGIRSEIEKAGALKGGVVGALKTVSGASHALTGGYQSGRKLFSKVHEKFGGRVRVFISGGAALDPDVFEDFQKMGFPICEGYGLTETAPVLTVNPLEKTRRGSVGPPLPNIELRLENADADGVGEIAVRGPSIMKGYYKNDEATNKVLKGDWFHTGDLGRLDEEGYLTITGRIKDLIVTAAGKNVYPDEVEYLYRDLPTVKEMSVVGLRPEGSVGEQVHLVLVLDGDKDASEAEREIQQQVARISRDVPSYQRVQKVHFWYEEFPKTPTLKVKRALIQKMLLDEETPGTEESAEVEEADSVAENASWEDEFVHLLSDLSRVPAKDIRADSDLQFDLMMDSLMKVELLVAAERQYGVRLPESHAPHLHAVQDAMNIVRSELEKQQTASEPELDDHRAVDWSHILKSGDLPQAELDAINNKGGINGLAGGVFQKSLRTFCNTYFQLKVEGLENLPDSGPFIIAANHSSHLDSLAILSSIPDHTSRLRILGARDYFFNRYLKGWFFRNFLNVLPFDRQENFLEGLRISRACIENDNILLIFPEGTRSVTGEIQSFKVGMGIIAYELEVPIVPARIHGSYQALPKGRTLPRKTPITVTFGDPIDPANLEPDTTSASRFPLYQEIVDSVRERIIELG